MKKLLAAQPSERVSERCSGCGLEGMWGCLPAILTLGGLCTLKGTLPPRCGPHVVRDRLNSSLRVPSWALEHAPHQGSLPQVLRAREAACSDYPQASVSCLGSAVLDDNKELPAFPSSLFRTGLVTLATPSTSGDGFHFSFMLL